jgi:hypothetical protein
MRGDIERWVRQAREAQAGALRARLGSYDRMRWDSLARGDQALAARYDALIQDAERALGCGAGVPCSTPLATNVQFGALSQRS